MIAVGLCALAGGAMAVLAGACSDPFSSEGYVGGDGGGHVGDAAAGSSDGGSSVNNLPSDGITDTTCMALSCNAMKAECGSIKDGCGRQLDCGQCHQVGQSCVGNTCTCTPKSEDAGDCQNAVGTPLCGLVPDGCGGLFSCPTCTDGTSCQLDSTCELPVCKPRTVPPGSCGTISDGCGSFYPNVATCPTTDPPGTTCNGGDEAGVCGCTPYSCGQQGWSCGTGTYSDLCGGTVTCGDCSDPPGQCGDDQRCLTCTRVYHILGYDDQCMTTAHPYAWACDCVDGGTCVVPDGVKAAMPTCQPLLNTDQHAVYCCDEPQ